MKSIRPVYTRGRGLRTTALVISTCYLAAVIMALVFDIMYPEESIYRQDGDPVYYLDWLFMLLFLGGYSVCWFSDKWGGILLGLWCLGGSVLGITLWDNESAWLLFLPQLIASIFLLAHWSMNRKAFAVK